MKRKIIFSTLGTRGDLYPYLGIAVEMKRRNYPVMLLGSEDFREPTEAAGIEFESILSQDEHDEVMRHPDTWKSYVGLKICLEKIVLPSLERTYRAVERQLKTQDCILVCNNITLGAQVAAEKFNLPIATIWLHPYSHLSSVDPSMDTRFKNFVMRAIGVSGRRFLFSKVGQELNSILLPVNDLRQQVGLPCVADVFRAWRETVPLMIDLWPEWYCAGKSDWPTQAVRTGFVNYDGPARPNMPWIEELGLAEFLKDKPIVFTMGSGMIQNFDGQVKLFSKTCDRLGKKGLMVSAAMKGRGSLTINGNFRVIEAVPFAELFPFASMILTHGGIGTVARGLESSRPLFVAPLAFDQFDNGYHVQKLGVGRTLPFSSLTPKKLAAGLQQLDSPDIRTRCTQFSERMKKESGVSTTVDLLEKTFDLKRLSEPMPEVTASP
jgi:rhamnosyltransferase subunit B